MSIAKFSAWCCEPDHVDNQWHHDSGSPAQCFWCAYSDIRRPGVFGWHFSQQLAVRFLYPSTFDNVIVRLWTSKWWGGFPRAVIARLCATPPPRWLIIIIKRQLKRTYRAVTCQGTLQGRVTQINTRKRYNMLQVRMKGQGMRLKIKKTFK